MSHRYCPECGFQNPETANYCAKCGSLLVRGGERRGDDGVHARAGRGAAAGRARRSSGIKGPALVVRSGGGRAGETFLLEGDETTIGRSPECDIFLDDVTVSRRHAIVEREAAAGSRSRTSAASTGRSSTASESSRRRALATATSCRSASTGSPSSNDARRPHPSAHAAADDRRRLRAAEGASSRTSRSRRSATSRARGSSRRSARAAATGCSARRSSSGWRRSSGSSATSSCR